MRVTHSTAIGLAIAALAVSSVCAAPVVSKANAKKWAPSKTRTVESLEHSIDRLLRAPLSQSPTGTIMSPTNATRVNIVMANGEKNVTLIDARTAGVAGQWTITATSRAEDIGRVTSAVLEGMGLKPAPAQPATLLRSKSEPTK